MYIYYKTNYKNIYKILSNLVININKDIVYLVTPSISEDDILFKLKINDSKNFEVIKYDDKTGYINKIFNLENQKFKIYFYNQERIDEIKKIILSIKEIKINKDFFEKFEVYKDDFEHYEENNQINMLPNSVISKNRNIYRKLDLLKGIVYCAFIDKKHLNKYLLDEYSVFYEEYKTISNVIDELRNKNRLNNNLYKVLNKSKVALKNEIESNLKKACFNDILIEQIDKRKIKFNNKYLRLAENDIYLFEIIIEICVNKLFYINNTKEKVVKLVQILDNYSEKYNIKDDMKILNERIINENYSVNVGDLDNIVLKNLFAVCIKYDNDIEFTEFLIEKNIEKKYMAYIFLGGIVGLMYLNSTIISNTDTKLIKDNILKIENELLDVKEQRYNNRLKIHYYLNNLYNYLGKINFENDELIIDTDSNTKKMNIYIKSDKSKMSVSYHYKSKNMAKTIRYYDNRNKELSYIIRNYKPLDIYFSYKFNIKGREKSLDYRYEYIYSIILEHIFLMKGNEYEQ